ncbi:rhodanese-like domain-containing protein [Amycolatopsis taiwanensis]|uniref:rhodanese-like domain-containing protein n=1 Tax=Amycolatopsis taiwanensis TaxID=342230 RepID=UPI00255443A0|nr:rhodanese-like domain-containing protein [Amycolatopsis taiwanensis]
MTPEQAHARLHEFTVIDVRTAAEYAAGRVPGAKNIPLDQLDQALPALKSAAKRAELIIVCASGARAARAQKILTAHGVGAVLLTGGTNAWQQGGYELERTEGTRPPWAMERQVRLTAGSLVLTGLLAGLRWPLARFLSAGVAGGLVYSALTNTCGMARLLAKLPFNRARTCDLNTTLTNLSD